MCQSSDLKLTTKKKALILSLGLNFSAGLAVYLPVKASMQMCMLAICGCCVMAALGFLILVCVYPHLSHLPMA